MIAGALQLNVNDVASLQIIFKFAGPAGCGGRSSKYITLHYGSCITQANYKGITVVLIAIYIATFVLM